MSIEERAWALMVERLGDAVHEMPDLAEQLLPHYIDKLLEQSDRPDITAACEQWTQ